MDPRQDSDLALGKVIGGRFRIDGTVGRGGYGVVYRATCVNDGRQVAIKVLHERLCEDERVLKRFHREAAMTQALEHENIVSTVDIGRTESGAAYIALELLEGSPLNAWAKGAPVAWQDAALIGRQVLSALAVAHEAGIAHRDIKPGNVFLCGSSPTAVKVLDFGIAKAFEQPGEDATKLTETGALMGTPRYMAPEQVRALPDVDHRADIYAVGVMLAGLVLGEPLLKGRRPVDVLFAHVSPAEHALPPALRETPMGPIIERAVRKDRGERYQSAREMRDALDDVLGPSAPSIGAPISGSVASSSQGTVILDEVVEPVPPTTPSASPEATLTDPALANSPVHPGMREAPTPSAPTTGGSYQPIHVPAPAPAPKSKSKVWVVALAAIVFIALGGGAGWHFLGAPGTTSAAKSKKKASSTKKKGSKKKRRKSRKGDASAAEKKGTAGVAKLDVDALAARIGKTKWKVTGRGQPQASGDATRTDLQLQHTETKSGGAVSHYRHKTTEAAAAMAPLYTRMMNTRVAHEGEIIVTVYSQDGGESAQRLLEQLVVP